MEVVQEDLSHCYITLPERRQGRIIRDVGSGQIIWAAGWGLMSIACLIVGQALVGLSLLVIAVLGFWPFERAAGYKLPALWLGGGRVKRRDGHVGGTEEEPVVLNLQVDNFLDVLGVVHDNERNTDTAYLAVRGFKAANADTAEQAAAHQLMAEALKTMISQTTFDISYGFIVGARPFDPTDWAGDTNERYLHQDRLQAYVDLPPDQLHRSMDEWLQEIAKGSPDAVNRAQMANMDYVWHGTAEHGADFYRIVYLTVARPLAWKKIMDTPGSFTAQQFSFSPLARVFTTLEEGLRTAGFIGVHMMKRDEVRQFVYRSWNVVTNDEAFADGKPMGFHGARSIWPEQEIKVHRDYLQTDTCFHAVLMTKRFGRRRILPNSMGKFLVNHPKWVLTTTNVNTVSARKDQYFLRQRRLLHHSIQRDRGGLDEQQDRDIRRADAEAVDLIYQSGSKAVRFNVPILVSATSTETLELRVEAEEANLRQQGMGIRRVTGRTTLPKGFIAATLGVGT